MYLIAALFVALSTPGAPPEKVKEVRVGIAFDGLSETGRQIEAVFREEILGLTKGEFSVVIREDKRAVGDWTLEGARAAIDRLMADPEIDIVLALGLTTSSELARRPNLPKPSLGAYIIDARLQDIPFSNGSSGKKNLTYVMSPDTLARDLEVFKALAGFTKLTAIAPKVFFDAVPNLEAAAKLQAKNIGIELSILPIAHSADEALKNIPAGTEAIYVAPILQLEAAEQEKLIRGLIEKKLPSFSLWGRSDVERGMLATALAKPDYPRRARRIALHIQRILLGEDAGTLPVLFQREEGLVLNMATARAIGFSPSWTALTEAELIENSRVEAERKLSMKSAAEEAIAQNLDLAANHEALSAAEQDVKRAYSPLLPQITANAAGTILDADRAAASFGQAPERSLSVSGRATQLIYAEQAWANLDVQKELIEARRASREALKLDVVLEASNAYLNVLRGKSLERVRRENLRKTKANLELARVRSAAGAVGRSEVLRWEAQLANDRRSVIESSAQRNAAEIALNRVLGRPLEEAFFAADVALDDPSMFVSRRRVAESLGNPAAFRIYRGFVVEEGLAASWELKQLDRVIAASERSLRSAKLAFWIPTVALQGDISQRVLEGGEGVDGPMLPPMFAGLIPATDNLTWSVSAVATFPIFLGTSRYADVDKAEHELLQRKTERRSVAEKLEQNIRSALHIAGSSYPAIELSRDAARAAKENLDIVTDAYSKGAVPIVVLLDAQNASLLSDEASANATYTFLLDHLRAQRAANWFDFLAAPEEVTAWLERFSKYRESHREGVAP